MPKSTRMTHLGRSEGLLGLRTGHATSLQERRSARLTPASRVAHRVLRRQNDYCAARAADPSLLHRRGGLRVCEHLIHAQPTYGSERFAECNLEGPGHFLHYRPVCGASAILM